MESEIVNTGDMRVRIYQNFYAAGDTVTIKYKNAATQGDIAGAVWNTYSGEFTSLGYIQVRIEV